MISSIVLRQDSFHDSARHLKSAGWLLFSAREHSPNVPFVYIGSMLNDMQAYCKIEFLTRLSYDKCTDLEVMNYERNISQNKYPEL